MVSTKWWNRRLQILVHPQKHGETSKNSQNQLTKKKKKKHEKTESGKSQLKNCRKTL